MHLPCTFHAPSMHPSSHLSPSPSPASAQTTPTPSCVMSSGTNIAHESASATALPNKFGPKSLVSEENALVSDGINSSAGGTPASAVSNITASTQQWAVIDFSQVWGRVAGGAVRPPRLSPTSRPALSSGRSSTSHRCGGG